MSRTFKLYGTSELASLNEAISQKVIRWLSDWSSNAESFDSLEISTHSPVIAGETYYGATYDVEGSALSVALDEALYTAFPDVLSSFNVTNAARHTSVVAQILDNVFYDLVRSLLKPQQARLIEKTALEKIEVDNNQFDIQKSSGDLLIKLSFKQGIAYLLLPYEIVSELNTYQPEKAVKQSSLVNRNKCSITGEVLLNVTVGEAEVDFGSVVDMQVGDVIRLDSKITDLMTVSTEDGEFVCDAYLGKQDTKKAIKVIIRAGNRL